MRADNDGNIALLSKHLQRLRSSAATLHFAYPGDQAVISTLADRLANNTHRKDQGPHEHRVRLLLSPEGEITITLARLDPIAPNQRVALSKIFLPSDNPWLQHKSTFRPWYSDAPAWLAQHPDFFDLIYLNENSQLCEGSRSNIYLKFDNEWLTPPLPSGLLGGVQRLDLLQRGYVKVASLNKSDLLAATQWRLSNALRGWFDVRLDLSVSD